MVYIIARMFENLNSKVQN